MLHLAAAVPDLGGVANATDLYGRFLDDWYLLAQRASHRAHARPMSKRHVEPVELLAARVSLHMVFHDRVSVPAVEARELAQAPDTTIDWPADTPWAGTGLCASARTTSFGRGSSSTARSPDDGGQGPVDQSGPRQFSGLVRRAGDATSTAPPTEAASRQRTAGVGPSRRRHVRGRHRAAGSGRRDSWAAS
jgi:hypothetical protein